MIINTSKAIRTGFMLTAFLSSPLHSMNSNLNPEEQYKSIFNKILLRSINFDGIQKHLNNSLPPIRGTLPEIISSQIATIKDSIGEALKLAKKHPDLIFNQKNTEKKSILMYATVINDANSVDDILDLIPSGDDYGNAWHNLVHKQKNTNGSSAYNLTPTNSKLKNPLISVRYYKKHLFWQKIIRAIKWVVGFLAISVQLSAISGLAGIGV